MNAGEYFNRQSARPARILIADDDPTTRELLTGLVQALGYEAVAVPDGVTAFGAIAGDPPDLGKVAVPEAILLKAGPLTPEERAVMQKHSVVGEEICRPLRSLHAVLPIIRHHHEKQDGAGYPDGLQGEAVPVTARILQVVDVFDALTTDRPYRRALPRTAALETLGAEARRGWWDPQIVRAFPQMLDGKR